LERGALEDPFMLTYGDSYLPIDVAAVAAAFEKHAKPALMTVFHNGDRWDTSNVIFDPARNTVTLYDKSRALRPGEYQYIDYGLSVVRREVIETLVPATGAYDLADVFRELSVRNALAGYAVQQRFYEIGSKAGLNDLQQLLGR
jgi:NDP-sugar pyrophosphorylase family protein